MYDWKDQAVLVTGGASFIGSHLVEILLGKGARVRVADDLSSGFIGNLSTCMGHPGFEFVEGDLLDQETTRRVLKEMRVVFHLAAKHGGRGYVDLRQADCATNFALDGQVFREAVEAGVEKIIYASSGCVYPSSLQGDPERDLYLTEDLVGPPYEADGLYGWAKLMAEKTLNVYAREKRIKAASCRYFTVYGPRGKENHAVMAFIAKAFIRQCPYEVWGTGEQIRNWTHVDDIVRGTILAAEKLDDGSAINLGTMERIRVLDAVNMILRQFEYDPEIVMQPGMPTGPLNRVADNRRAKELLGWQPEVLFKDGVKKTVDWYVATKDRDEVARLLEAGALIERRMG